MQYRQNKNGVYLIAETNEDFAILHVIEQMSLINVLGDGSNLIVLQQAGGTGED